MAFSWMNGFLLLFLRGRGVKQVFYIKEKQFCTAKAAKKNSCRGSHGPKIKQILSAITILIFDAKRYSWYFCRPKKTMHTPNMRKKIHAPHILPSPQKKKMVRPLGQVKKNTFLVPARFIFLAPPLFFVIFYEQRFYEQIPTGVTCKVHCCCIHTKIM